MMHKEHCNWEDFEYSLTARFDSFPDERLAITVDGIRYSPDLNKSELDERIVFEYCPLCGVSLD
jgi:hypothetical protein